MRTQDELVRHLKRDVGLLTHPRMEEAFRAVPREYFVPRELQDEAYEDYPLPIGYGATISQPTTVAFMLEKLDVKEGQKVLDIGSGSGWTTALLAHLVGETGRVIGLEIIPELVRLGQKNLAKYHSYIRTNVGMRLGSAEIREAKRGVIGLPAEAPFDPVRSREGTQRASASNGVDRILVSAAAKEIPKELMDQLKVDGIMVIPIGRDGAIQSLVKIAKQKDGSLESEEYPGFAFVPLVS